MRDDVSPGKGSDALPRVTMQRHQRTFDRTVVAKLSDARERLHALVERARAADAEPPITWPRDINAPEGEVPRG